MATSFHTLTKIHTFPFLQRTNCNCNCTEYLDRLHRYNQTDATNSTDVDPTADNVNISSNTVVSQQACGLQIIAGTFS